MTLLLTDAPPSPEPQIYRQLMARSQNGCRKSYSDLLTRFDAILQEWLGLPSYGNDKAAERLLEDILCSAHRNLGTCNPSQPVLPWLMGIAKFRDEEHSKRQAQANAPLAFLFSKPTGRAFTASALKRAA